MGINEERWGAIRSTGEGWGGMGNDRERGKRWGVMLSDGEPWVVTGSGDSKVTRAPLRRWLMRNSYHRLDQCKIGKWRICGQIDKATDANALAFSTM